MLGIDLQEEPGWTPLVNPVRPRPAGGRARYRALGIVGDKLGSILAVPTVRGYENSSALGLVPVFDMPPRGGRIYRWGGFRQATVEATRRLGDGTATACENVYTGGRGFRLVCVSAGLMQGCPANDGFSRVATSRRHVGKKAAAAASKSRRTRPPVRVAVPLQRPSRAKFRRCRCRWENAGRP